MRRVIELRAELQRAEGKRGQEDERDTRRKRLRRELLRVAIPVDHPCAEFDTTLNLGLEMLPNYNSRALIHSSRISNLVDKICKLFNFHDDVWTFLRNKLLPTSGNYQG